MAAEWANDVLETPTHARRWGDEEDHDVRTRYGSNEYIPDPFLHTGSSDDLEELGYSADEDSGSDRLSASGEDPGSTLRSDAGLSDTDSDHSRPAIHTKSAGDETEATTTDGESGHAAVKTVDSNGSMTTSNSSPGVGYRMLPPSKGSPEGAGGSREFKALHSPEEFVTARTFGRAASPPAAAEKCPTLAIAEEAYPRVAGQIMTKVRNLIHETRHVTEKMLDARDGDLRGIQRRLRDLGRREVWEGEHAKLIQLMYALLIVLEALRLTFKKQRAFLRRAYKELADMAAVLKHNRPLKDISLEGLLDSAFEKCREASQSIETVPNCRLNWQEWLGGLLRDCMDLESNWVLKAEVRAKVTALELAKRIPTHAFNMSSSSSRNISALLLDICAMVDAGESALVEKLCHQDGTLRKICKNIKAYRIALANMEKRTIVLDRALADIWKYGDNEAYNGSRTPVSPPWPRQVVRPKHAVSAALMDTTPHPLIVNFRHAGNPGGLGVMLDGMPDDPDTGSVGSVGLHCVNMFGVVDDKVLTDAIMSKASGILESSIPTLGSADSSVVPGKAISPEYATLYDGDTQPADVSGGAGEAQWPLSWLFPSKPARQKLGEFEEFVDHVTDALLALPAMQVTLDTLTDEATSVAFISRFRDVVFLLVARGILNRIRLQKAGLTAGQWEAFKSVHERARVFVGIKMASSGRQTVEDVASTDMFAKLPSIQHAACIREAVDPEILLWVYSHAILLP